MLLRFRFGAVLIAAVCFAPAAGSAAPPPVAVTTCGQEVPRKTVGYLTGDLDCTGYEGGTISGLAVVLHDKATLDLRGFTLTGGRFGVGCFEPCPDASGNSCVARRCRIVGGGAIVDSLVHAVSGGRQLRVEGTTFSGHDVVFHNFFDVRLTGVTLTGNADPLHGVDQVRLLDSTVTNNGRGLESGRIKTFGSTVIDNGAYDLWSPKRPLVKRGSICGVAAGPGVPFWGVCTGG